MELDIENIDKDCVFGIDEELFGDKGLEPIEGLAEATGGEENADSENAEIKKKPAKKAGIPLNENVLCGKHGIRRLLEVFKDVQLKGNNVEDDLNVLLKNFEFWAHQMYPRHPFADVVERVEDLGSKKMVRRHANAVKMGEVEDVDVGLNVDERDTVQCSKNNSDSTRDSVQLG